MRRFTSRLGLLGALWMVACATAEDGQPPTESDGGSSAAGRAGAAKSGASNSSAAAGASGSGAVSHGGNSGQTAGASSGSLAGSAGHATIAGSGGAPGSGGGAGAAAGTGPVFESGACAATPTMSLKYLHSGDNPKQITGQFQFSNVGETPIALAQLKIRYFFSNEETSGWSAAIYDSKLEGGTGGYRAISGTTLTVNPLGVVVPGADSYFELAFASSLSIETGAVGTISWDLQPHSYNPPDQVQADDYSYDAGAVSFEVWDHVVIYQGDQLVWGCLPKSDSGSGGNGGASGGANAGSGGASAGSGGANAGSAGTSAGSAGANAGSAGASAGSAGASAGSAGASAGSGGANAGSSGAVSGGVGGDIAAGTGGINAGSGG